MNKFQTSMSKRMKKILKDHPIQLFLCIVGLEVLIFFVTGICNAGFTGVAIAITTTIYWYLHKNIEPLTQESPYTTVRQNEMKKYFKTLCEKYREKNKNILIVGDVMLDHKMVGIEAKYEIVQKHQIIESGGEVYMVDDEHKTLGGAADIAWAFSEVSHVTLIGVIGLDCEGTTLKTLCENRKISFKPIVTDEVLTTTKIYLHRLTEGPAKDVIRFDRENRDLMTSHCNKENVQDDIINKINEAIKNINCIVIKDHQKGMISKELVKKISETASNNNIPLYVDPKYDWEKFEDVKIAAILPNMKEAASGVYDIEKEKRKILEGDNVCKLNDNEYETLVRKYSNCDNFIIKAASKGAVILSRNANPEEIKPFLMGDDFKTDVGCGDVFDAFTIIGLLHEPTPEELHKHKLKVVLFANFVAGLKTGKPLEEFVSFADIEKELEQESFKKYIRDNVQVVNKIMGIEE